MSHLTKTEARFLKLVFTELRRIWQQSERNLGVIASSPDGARDMSRGDAERKLALIKARLRKIDILAGRLGIERIKDTAS